MPLTKVTYQDYQTTISAQNLNDIQDAIIDLEDAVDDIDTSGSGYTPPAGGIPLTDLASSVQTSLGKADTAVQGVKGDNETNYRTGTVNITKANIGLGNVENKSSATIRGEITSQNVIDALGYTPGQGYGSMTTSEATTGTSQTAKVISASVLNAAIENKGYTTNVGTITGINMNGESKGTSGVVNLGTVLTAHQDISGKVDKVSGKGLSTNDYTTADKSVVNSIKNTATLEYVVVTQNIPDPT